MRNNAARTILTASLICILAVLPVRVYADGTAGLTFTGTSDFIMTAEDQWTSTDMFEDMKDMMPGDSATEKIVIKNTSKEYDSVKLYIRAAAHDEKDNPLSEAVAAKESVASMEDFLSQLHMTVRLGDETIFSDTPEKTSGMTENILIGELAKDQEKELIVTVEVPDTIGDEYQFRAGEVDWIFTAEGIERAIKESDPKKESPAKTVAVSDDTKTAGSIETANAATGDETTEKAFCCSVIFACAAAMLILEIKRKKKTE